MNKMHPLDITILIGYVLISVCLLGMGTPSLIIYTEYDLNNTGLAQLSINDTSYNIVKECINDSRGFLFNWGIAYISLSFVLAVFSVIYGIIKYYDKWTIAAIFGFLVMLFLSSSIAFSAAIAFRCQEFNYLYYPIWNCLVACFSVSLSIISIVIISFCFGKCFCS